MHHRAVALVAPRAQSHHSFSYFLQQAAARAWVRRSSVTPPASSEAPPAKRHVTPHSQCSPQNIPTSSQSIITDHHALQPPLRSSKPKSNKHEHAALALGRLSTTPNELHMVNPRPPLSPITEVCSGSNRDDHSPSTTAPLVPQTDRGFARSTPTMQPSKVPSGKGSLNTQIHPPPYQDLSAPLSALGFHQNLIRLIYYTSPPLEFPVIMDYFNLYPQFHTTRSYNLVLAIALRHTAYSAFKSLARSMRLSPAARNLETWKLEVRWLVSTGSWSRAWKRVTDPRSGLLGAAANKPSIPLPIWLEFFHLPKRDHISKRGKSFGIANTPSSRSQQARLTWDPRLKLLFHLAPETASDYRQLKPHIIRPIITQLLRLNHPEHALSLTTSYLRALPRRLDARWKRGCIDIINSHVALGSTSTGLRHLSESSRLLTMLFELHPSLAPNSTTLFLLLSTLHRAKQCGTHAEHFVKGFTAKWGQDLVDDRVRRRIVTLAMKERRMDIVAKYAEFKTVHGFRRHVFKATSRCTKLITREWAMRRSRLSLHRKLGRERKLWLELWLRARKLSQQESK
ncbi:hypothetical protein FA15DRAFT_2416 [Coprinopsis marcescibilis]|uniref:Uncharacterized protein n=1 Tax=Coprinopsis marcescibilis TaxID=230819 RepID=A0A5C3LEJ5_COPMA|nr:hypothetical protein FA15DRAFT_2416 [Coprinopsis marcescibilis]